MTPYRLPLEAKSTSPMTALVNLRIFTHKATRAALPATTISGKISMTFSQLMKIAAGLIGGVAIGIVLILIVICWVRKKKTSENERVHKLQPHKLGSVSTSNLTSRKPSLHNSLSRPIFAEPTKMVETGRTLIGQQKDIPREELKLQPPFPHRPYDLSPRMLSRRFLEPESVGLAFTPDPALLAESRPYQSSSKLLRDNRTLEFAVPPTDNRKSATLSVQAVRKSDVTQFELDDEISVTTVDLNASWGSSSMDQILENIITAQSDNLEPSPSTIPVIKSADLHWRPIISFMDSSEQDVQNPFTESRNSARAKDYPKPLAIPNKAAPATSSVNSFSSGRVIEPVKTGSNNSYKFYRYRGDNLRNITQSAKQSGPRSFGLSPVMESAVSYPMIPKYLSEAQTHLPQPDFTRALGPVKP